MKNIILKECGQDVYEYLSQYADLGFKRTSILFSTQQSSVNLLTDFFYTSIINLAKINDIRRINKFFEAVNSKLPNSGIFIGLAETMEQRNRRVIKKYPFWFTWFYFIIDFIFKRVVPKVWGVKKIYFALTSGRNRVISKAEVLGRIVSCGFDILDYKEINNKLYFVGKKTREPYFDANPSYGPIFKMRRIGKNGKVIFVYKFRTMHPFSEYLQKHIYELNQLDKGGKFKNDFRITFFGSFMRKIWLDELPMLYNLLTGKVKPVGVRPLSEQYLGLYREEVKQKRLKHKPGIIPPFYVDMPKTLDEIMASEMRYLEAYEKHPFKTDFNYFFKAVFNILFKKARSR
jgi:lipopolysaccharide/colanic/teichoic acid biosynthesis glycosyltransferase